MRAQKAAGVDHDLGRRIYKLRYGRGLTAGELGARIGVSAQQISKYENGQSRLPVSRLLEICMALDVPAAQLLDGLPGSAGRDRPDERRSSAGFLD